MVTLQFTTAVWQHTAGGNRTITSPTADGSAAERETANFTPHSLSPEVARRVSSQRSKRNKKLYFDRQTKTLSDPQTAGENVRVQKGGTWPPAAVLRYYGLGLVGY